MYINDFLHSVKIDVKVSPEFKETRHLFWKDLRNDQLIRWNWFFKYVEATIRVKYPKAIINIVVSSYAPAVENASMIYGFKIKAKKRVITIAENKLKGLENEFHMFIENTNEMFIESNPTYIEYQKAFNKQTLKIKLLYAELTRVENEYNQIIKK